MSNLEHRIETLEKSPRSRRNSTLLLAGALLIVCLLIGAAPNGSAFLTGVRGELSA